MHMLSIMYAQRGDIEITLSEQGSGRVLQHAEFSGVQEAYQEVSRLLSRGEYPKDMASHVGIHALLIMNMRLSTMCNVFVNFSLPLLSGMTQVMPAIKPQPDMNAALGLTEVHSLQAIERMARCA